MGFGETITRLLDKESTGECWGFLQNCVVLDLFGHLFPELGSNLNGSRNALDVKPFAVIAMLNQVAIEAALGKQS